MPPDFSPEKTAILTKEGIAYLISQPFAANVKFSIQSETPEELTARLQKEKEEGRANRKGQLIAMCFAFGLVFLLFVACLLVILSGKYPTDIEKWATVTLTSILTSTITGALGYAWGKSTAK